MNILESASRRLERLLFFMLGMVAGTVMTSAIWAVVYLSTQGRNA